MIRKNHNHKLQTNPWHHEEEPHNHHETPGRQIKYSNQPPLPHQDDCKTRIYNKPLNSNSAPQWARYIDANEPIG